MRIAIHQPNYLPWIGFFDKLDQVDKFVLLDKAIHSKKGFVNRNKIKTPDGAYWLTVPLKDKEIPINEIQVSNEVNWREKHWKAIESNYKKCLFWNDYSEGFRQIFNQRWENLAEFNIELIKHMNNLLNVQTPIFLESELQLDFGVGNARNINIVSYLGGDTYLSGIGAKAYNDESKFIENQINLVYQDFKHPNYPQRWNGFCSNLSIIDMLFNCGSKTIEIIREQRI
jgi:hypothetical protein